MATASPLSPTVLGKIMPKKVGALEMHRPPALGPKDLKRQESCEAIATNIYGTFLSKTQREGEKTSQYSYLVVVLRRADTQTPTS